MWKKIIIFTSVFFLSIASIGTNSMEVSAEESMGKVDNSYLSTENEIIGYMDEQTRGVYLGSGYSVIKEGGNGKIIAGGGTNATTRCKVALNVIVERLDGGSWYRVTSWSVINENAISALSSKTISVGSGYYYRVRCLHAAASDASSSMTSSLWM